MRYLLLATMLLLAGCAGGPPFSLINPPSYPDSGTSHYAPTGGFAVSPSPGVWILPSGGFAVQPSPGVWILP